MTIHESEAIRKVVAAWQDVDFVLEVHPQWGDSQRGEFYSAVERMNDSLRDLQYATGMLEPPHQTGCICADCSGAELTADND